MENSFLPSGYVAPATGGYTSFEVGQTTFRVLSNPLMVWVVWENGAVRRVPYSEPQPVVAAGDKNSVQHGWCMVVWNYNKQCIEICEITQKTLQSGIKALADNPAWGHPSKYDIIVTKTGSGKEGTKYMLQSNPHSELSDAGKLAYTETPIDLNQLLVPGGNPFLPVSGAAAANVNHQPVQQQQKTVTPENWVAGDAVPAGFAIGSTGMLEKKALPFG